MVPPLVAIFAGLVAYLEWTKPIVTSVDYGNFKGQSDAVEITCTSPAGCYYTEQYTGDSAKYCLKSKYNNACYFFNEGTSWNATICYSNKPTDGPFIIWDKNQECTADGVSDNECFTGMKIKVPNYRLNAETNEFVANYTFQQIYYGVYALQYNFQKVVSDDAATTEVKQFAAIQVNSENNIPTTTESNKCCDSGSSGAIPSCGPSPEDDYFSARLRAFPLFQRTTNTITVNIALAIASSTGSFVTILLVFLTGFAKAYRMFYLKIEPSPNWEFYSDDEDAGDEENPSATTDDSETANLGIPGSKNGKKSNNSRRKSSAAKVKRTAELKPSPLWSGNQPPKSLSEV